VLFAAVTLRATRLEDRLDVADEINFSRSGLSRRRPPRRMDGEACNGEQAKADQGQLQSVSH
jgi:hypothetical protein